MNAYSNKPRSSNRKRPVPLIDLQKNDFEPETKSPNNGRRILGREKGSAAGRPGQKVPDEKPEKGKKGTNKNPALQNQEGADGRFGDTFDVNRAPEG